MTQSRIALASVLALVAILGLVALNVRVLPAYRARLSLDNAKAQVEAVLSKGVLNPPAAPEPEPIVDAAVVPGPIPEPEPEPVLEPNPPALHDPVFFDSESYAVPEDVTVRLERIAADLQSNRRRALMITGFAPPVGTDRYNRFMAKQRARSIRDRLLELGIGRGRLKTEAVVFAKRETYALAPGEAHRVEFKVLGK